MEHIAVTSNQIASLAYAPATGIMQVLFRRGGLYEYQPVEMERFEAVLHPAAEDDSSVGKAFDRLIKKNPHIRYEKLPGGDGAPPELRVPSNVLSIKEFVASEGGVEKAASRIFAMEPEAEAPLPAEVQQVSTRSTELTERAKAIEVVDPGTQSIASEILLAVASMRAEIADTFKPMKDAAYKAHKVVCDQERKVDAPLAAVEVALKAQIGTYVQEQQRLARVADEALREAERLRAEQEAAKATVEQALEQAVDLEARGNTAAAEAVLAHPAPVPARYIAPAPVAAAVAQVKGVTTRMEWDFRITDIRAVPDEYKLINETAIRSAGKNTKGRIKIAGVEFFEKPVVAASRGR